jgi:DNA mismatch repair ATPase MutS
LKLIIEKYERGEEVFILLDEILKGTNSKDQHLGSESLIKKLLRLNGVGIIATHDIELANLEKLYPKQVTNQCFEIKTELDKLIFDYKIKPGYCTVMNASILMKQIGIID